MVDVTASLDAATQQVLALLTQIRLSNVRAVQAQDIGAADAYLFAPIPNVTAYGADLVLVADIATPNATSTPKLTIQGLATVPIQAADGSNPAIGTVAGKRLIGFSSIAGGGFAARLLGMAPADLANILASLLISSPDPASLLINAEFLICQGNYDFPVNGVPTTSFSMSQGQYVYDGWRGGAGGCTLNIGNNGFVTVAGVIEQVMEAPALAGETVTVCFDDVSTGANPAVPLPVTLTDGTYSVSGSVPIGAGPQGVSLAIPAAQAGNLILQVGSAAAYTWRRPRVIRGAAVRPFIRRPIGADLLMCQRYIFFPGASIAGLRRRDPTTYTLGPIGVGQAISATQAVILVPFHVPLQKKPSLEVVNPQQFSLSTSSGQTVQATAISLNTANNDYATVLVTVASGLSAGNGCSLLFTGAQVRFIFHSEL